jgi:hypothetical protein
VINIFSWTGTSSSTDLVFDSDLDNTVNLGLSSHNRAEISEMGELHCGDAKGCDCEPGELNTPEEIADALTDRDKWELGILLADSFLARVPACAGAGLVGTVRELPTGADRDGTLTRLS